MHVYPGLPAARAGMAGAYRGQRGEVILGDIITAIDGQPIRSNSDYYDALEGLSPGDTVTLSCRRGDKEKSYRIEVIESQ